MNNFYLYRIRCLTNMHVGDGDATYSIIDNKVQRDVITNFPTINASSLKGSLRNFLEDYDNNENIKLIFGSKTSIGRYRIFPGMLLSIPVRSNKKPFFRATCKSIIKDLITFLKEFNEDKGLNNITKELDTLDKEAAAKNYAAVNIEDFEDVKECRIEGRDADLEKCSKSFSEITKLFGNDLLVIDDKIFNNIINDLPIIARNKLEDGESKNLWYEEVVPRETRFYFGVQESINKKHDNLEKEFEKINNKVIQIGGNATIGYGYCKIEKIVGDKNGQA